MHRNLNRNGQRIRASVTISKDLRSSLAEGPPQNAPEDLGKTMNMRRYCLVLLCFSATGAGVARSVSDASLCDMAATRAAEAGQVPLEILQAISRVETGRSRDGATEPWPWAINQAGQGYWFDDAAGAARFAEDQLALGEENFDLGCFQINLHWHGAHFASIEDALDPQTNADYAARFLLQLLESEGSWSAAVAAYHSRTPEEGEKYLTKVQAALDDLRGGAAAAPIYAAAAAPRENRFPLLQAGGQRKGASLVPVSDGGTPLFAMAP